MHLEVLVEEASAEAALKVLVPRILGTDISFKVRVFAGKPNLLRNLRARLSAYAYWPPETRIAVLIDEDREDCQRLKAELELYAADAGLISKTAAAPGQSFVVLNRIVIEELEAWFFGDCDALRAAYPRLSPTLEEKAPFRDPDAIAGGTAERLGRVLAEAGYHTGGLAKLAAATDIAQHMDPARNRSRSFQHFRSGLLAFAETD
jgi:hypothetical protein